VAEVPANAMLGQLEQQSPHVVLIKDCSRRGEDAEIHNGSGNSSAAEIRLLTSAATFFASGLFGKLELGFRCLLKQCFEVRI